MSEEQDDITIVNYRFLCAAIIILAFGLRCWGITFGLTQRYHPDESYTLDLVNRMVQADELNPRFFEWGSFYLYLVYAGHWLARLFGHPTTDALLTIIGRSISLVLGTLTVLLTGLCSRELGHDRQTSLLATLFLAISFLHCRCSHYLTIDVAATFWLVLAMYVLLLALRKTGLPLFFLAGLVLGGAIGTKYQTALFALSGLSVIGIHSYTRLRTLLARCCIYAVGIATGFIVTCPYSILFWSGFHESVLYLFSHYQDVTYRNSSDCNFVFFLQNLYLADWSEFLSILSLVGLVLVLRKRRAIDLGLYLFPVLLLIILSLMTSNFMRNLLPILPFLAFLSATASVWLWQGLIRPYLTLATCRRSVLILCLIGFCSLPLYRIAVLDYVLSQPDTRDRAGLWLSENVGPGSRFALEPEFWAYPRLPADSYYRYYMLPKHTVSWYRTNGVDYIITNSISSEAYFVYQNLMPDMRRKYELFFTDLRSNAILCQTFRGTRCPVPINDELPNPDLAIYRLRPSSAN
ncbi:phospholipid carrier-dependent glycosyltransferase [bacterium]|nr:phospholipid carrier-dependent glycosyltransferase [bacterium]